MQLFSDPLHNDFAVGALAYTRYGGLSAGELAALGQVVGDGNDDAFYTAFVDAGDRRVAAAEAKERSGHHATAGALLLRAAILYGLSFKPIYGTPVDPRLTAAFAKETDAFNRGLKLLWPHAPLRVPYENTTLPALFFPASGENDAPRPLLVFTNGYDTNVVDAYFATAVAARERGYHALIFDGPGQGEPLIVQGITMRPDWESVVAAVLDVATNLPGVDPARIALCGWSLGGYLAPRAASGDARIAACIADPGLAAPLAAFGRLAAKFGLPAATDPTALDDATLATMSAALAKDRRQHWAILQRGYWVLGASGLGDFLRRTAQYSLAGRVAAIRCPTLITAAENDPLSAGAKALYDQLTCPKTFAAFKAADGAGDHCEMQNRPLLNETVFDWLDETLPAAR
jgi:alpha-beta hydrolase superfamily lysophospholipase